MKGDKIVFAGVAATIVYFLLAKKQAVNLLNYFINGVSIDFEGLTPVLKLSIAIQNVSSVSFTIKSVVGTLYNNGKEIGTVSSFNTLLVPPISQVPYKLNIRLSLLSIVSDLIMVLQQKSGATQKLTFAGWVNAEGLLTPVNLDFTIP